jgi:DnaJ-class molecular chaperone
MQAKASGFFDAFYERFSNLTVTCNCTLEEFYYGCQKKVAFQRLVLQGDGKRQKMSVDKKLINVKPGMGPGSKLEFPGEGHIRAGQPASDLIIVF